MSGKTQIFGDQIVSGTITSTQISASASIAYSQLSLSNSIVNNDINAAASIAFSKLAPLTSAHILVGSAGNVATNVALSGDASLSNVGALTLATVNANVGSFTAASITVNAKGLITAAAASNSISALTGDATAAGPGSVALTLATVNANVGSFTNANITVNAKGLITAAANGTAGGVTSITGTANQIIASASTGAITLSTPQNIDTGATVNFNVVRSANSTVVGTSGSSFLSLLSQSQIQFNDSTNSHVINLRAPTTVPANYTLNLPTAQGAASTVLANDGSGNLSWAANGTGSVTQNTYTVGTPSGTYTGSTTLFNLPFTYVQDGKSLQVMYNGQVLVSGVDYNETSNTSVTFVNALTAGFTTVFRTITPQTPSNTSVAQYANFVIGTASGTYTGSTTVYNLPFAYTQDAKSLEIFYDGIQLVPGDDYTETSSTSITTTQALASGQKIAFRTISTIGTSAAVTALRENYVAGTASGNYTGSLTVFNLINAYTPGGINLQVYLDGDLQTVGASNDYVETNTTTVTFNFTLATSQKVTFLFSQTVAATGTVTTGTANTLAAYNSAGSTIASINANTSAGGFKVTNVANGTVSTDAAAYGQLKVDLISTATASASATVSFTGLSGANYSKFMIVLENIVASGSGVFLKSQVSTGSGFITTNYTDSQYRVIQGGGSGGGGQNNGTSWTVGPYTEANGTPNGQYGTLEIFGPDTNSANKWMTYNMVAVSSNGANLVSFTGGGIVSTNSANIDGLSFFMSSGNITSGKFYLYGLRNS